MAEPEEIQGVCPDDAFEALAAIPDGECGACEQKFDEQDEVGPCCLVGRTFYHCQAFLCGIENQSILHPSWLVLPLSLLYDFSPLPLLSV